MAEEEIFVVLRGRGTLLRGKERVAVEAGDVAAFPAGTGVAHAFVADLGEELEFLSIGERDDNDVVLYPDSGKLLVARLAGEDGQHSYSSPPYSPECGEGLSRKSTFTTPY